MKRACVSHRTHDAWRAWIIYTSKWRDSVWCCAKSLPHFHLKGCLLLLLLVFFPFVKIHDKPPHWRDRWQTGSFLPRNHTVMETEGCHGNQRAARQASLRGLAGHSVTSVKVSHGKKKNPPHLHGAFTTTLPARRVLHSHNSAWNWGYKHKHTHRRAGVLDAPPGGSRRCSLSWPVAQMLLLASLRCGDRPVLKQTVKAPACVLLWGWRAAGPSVTPPLREKTEEERLTCSVARKLKQHDGNSAFQHIRHAERWCRRTPAVILVTSTLGPFSLIWCCCTLMSNVIASKVAVFQEPLRLIQLLNIIIPMNVFKVNV